MLVNIENNTDDLLWNGYRDDIEDVIRTACEMEHFPDKYKLEVNVTFTTDDEIRRYNNEFRDIDKKTDVLSFPNLYFDSPADFRSLDDPETYVSVYDPEVDCIMAGDIVISVDTAHVQAEEYGHSYRREVCFLISHSILHLFGYDHMEDDERIVMEAHQKQILERLNITRDQAL
ncbi:MAG: rRNA maturation RNase YbeY [Lachnospiraceae bacterium]|nr:rRNA maturation RNase YbeY [Lachnospiraceae bacterium]MEE3461607.1 rRNA maturation RNase YbeY [Lachnospiraceae bacterium]